MLRTRRTIGLALAALALSAVSVATAAPAKANPVDVTALSSRGPNPGKPGFLPYAWGK